MGPDVCARLSVLPLLGTGLLEPAPLDRQSFDPARRPFPAIDQRLYRLFRSDRPAGNRRFIDRTRSCRLRAQMAHAVDSILHSQRTPASWREPSAVLLASRALRQSDLFTPGCRGSLSQRLM